MHFHRGGAKTRRKRKGKLISVCKGLHVAPTKSLGGVSNRKNMLVKVVSIFCLIFVCCAISCSDKTSEASLEGNYVGTFYRVSNNVQGNTSTVTLTLSNGRYDGTSTVSKYPAVCSGTYIETSEGVSFTNSCMWTAEFDWTLILNGQFKITRTDSELILVKEYNDANKDYYVLRRQ